MAPPEYPKIVVTPSSANTCTIISAPVIFWPASGWRMEGLVDFVDEDKSRRLFDFLGGVAIGADETKEFAAIAQTDILTGPYDQRRTAKNPSKDASYHRHSPAERGRRAHARHGPLQYPRLQHRVAVGSGHG